MSHLTKIELSIATLEKIGAMDNYSWHQAIWQCFPGKPEGKRDFLTRIDELDGMTRIFILSPGRPRKPDWCPDEAFNVKELARTFLTHGRYAFDLKANPTKREVMKGPDGEILKEKGKRGRRVFLRKADELQGWLERKGEANGFILSDEAPLEIRPATEHRFKARGNEGLHGGVQFRGILEVANTSKFIEGYHAGIGTAKGFGFGLLLVKPV